MKERGILEVLEIYRKRVAEFKRDLKKIGITKVKVTASLGVWTSTVEEVRR